MKLSRRLEDGHSVRTVEWGENSQSDLDVVVFLVALTGAAAGLTAAAASTTGWLHPVFTVLAIVAGAAWSVMAIPAAVLAIGTYVVKGMAAVSPTRLQQAAFAIPPGLFGALVGVAPYESGPPALVIGPLVATAVVATSWPHTSTKRVRVRLAVLSCLGAVVALAVGCTIFL